MTRVTPLGRNDLILKAKKEGNKTNTEIAVIFKLTKQRIGQILKVM